LWLMHKAMRPGIFRVKITSYNETTSTKLKEFK
jgi:hypothetical protein